MPCKAEYPKKPCPFGFDGRVTRETCGGCKNYDPPAYIKSWCVLWDRDRTLCNLPKSACETCAFKAGRAPGRPLGEGSIDWKDPESVRRYEKDWRARNKLLVEARRKRFLKRHPNYFERYRNERRDEINRKARERYRAKKEQEKE